MTDLGILVALHNGSFLDTCYFVVERDEYDHDRADGYTIPPRAYICPWCLSLWAQLSYPMPEKFEIVRASCAECNKPQLFYPVPGSILDSLFFESRVDWGLLDLLPLSLLKREFELHLAQIESAPRL